MEQICKHTGLTEKQVMSYSLTLGIVCVVFGIGASYITCLIGVAYPAFKSFLTLDEGKEEEMKQWLTYWVVFGCCNIVDHFAGFILHFIPFYYVLKLAFLVALFHPRINGATILYDSYLREAVKPLDKLAAEAERALNRNKHE